MTDLSFKVGKRNTDPITFDLEGRDHTYTFVPPKQAVMVLPMLDADSELVAAKAAFEWLDLGMSEEDREHLLARLKDAQDDLDFPHVEEVVTALVERTSARPTT